MHAFRIASPYPVAQTRFMCLLAKLHSNPSQRALVRLHNQTHVVQSHRDARWSTPTEIIARGLTCYFIILTQPFAEYMRLQIEALFVTTAGPATLLSTNTCKLCNTLEIPIPRLRITFTYSAVVVQGVGNGELIDSDRHFENLIQDLLDLRTDLRIALLMALHPRLGFNSNLGLIGEDLLQELCTVH